MRDEIRVCSDTFTIAAPAQQVWDVLVDFAHYGQWNGFCPVIKAELRLGSPVVMRVDLGGEMIDQTEFISCIDPPWRLAWAMANRPGDPVHAERVQRIEATGARSCTYVSYDIFTGEGAAEMVALVGEAVRDGFNRCGQGLKARAEALAGTT